MRVRIDSSTRSDADPHLNRHIHFQQKAKATVVTIGRQWMTKIRPSGFPCRNYVHQTGEISGVLGEHVFVLAIDWEHDVHYLASMESELHHLFT
jgi:hypothetical protein